jgi:hypothetical protein
MHASEQYQTLIADKKKLDGGHKRLLGFITFNCHFK